jgi:uncharacterized protein YqiB (DUF1249 family)
MESEVSVKFLNRGFNIEKIVARAKQIFELGTADSLIEYCVMVFHTRNIRGGKGERLLAYELFLCLFAYEPTLATNLLPLFGHYGYWLDLFRIAAKNSLLLPEVMTVVEHQLKADVAILETKENGMSLLAKWAPREKSHYDIFAKMLAQKLFPNEQKIQEALKKYRKTLSSLNHHLDTVEIKLCSQKTSEIIPSKMPKRAMSLYKKALLNEMISSENIRRPKDEDRIICAINFHEYMTKATKQSQSHEKTSSIINSIDEQDKQYDLVRDVVKAWFMKKELVRM